MVSRRVAIEVSSYSSQASEIKTLSLRSRRKCKAWGASPRFVGIREEPAKAGDSTFTTPVARFTGSEFYFLLNLGLAPQALRLRPLRGLGVLSSLRNIGPNNTTEHDSSVARHC